MRLVGCQMNHGNDCEEFLWLDEVDESFKEEEGNTYDYYGGEIPEEYKEQVANHACWMMGLPDKFPDYDCAMGMDAENWLLEFWQS